MIYSVWFQILLRKIYKNFQYKRYIYVVSPDAACTSFNKADEQVFRLDWLLIFHLSPVIVVSRALINYQVINS